ncbi:High choriolytic enzyme 1 [Triplophysa tibetana]|uniref:Metalloendopeptidase n=1 Tax=Triplophysa tibetana TaxID=1572043 RepID=A0A5A9PHH3_9TELE|nr:High choriolytic enzyme 1 [Triplophysa tibetana]
MEHLLLLSILNGLLNLSRAVPATVFPTDQDVESQPDERDISSRILEANKDTVEKAVIVSAMKNIAEKTCISFVPQTNKFEYIGIESLLGCWSSVGRTGGKQQLSLSVEGCVYYGIVEHELLHALGFHHEHTRSDRDQYVRINWENIPKASAYNFEEKDTNNLKTPYDYNSIMHYGRTSFSLQYGKETITPIPDSSVKIGQRQEMSNIDIQRINKLYECGK